MKRFFAQSTLLTVLILISACIKGPEVVTKTASVNGGGVNTSNARWPAANQQLALKIARDGTSFSAGEATMLEDMGNLWETAALNSDFFTWGRTANLEHSDPLDYYDSELGIYYHNTWFDPANYSQHGISSSALAVTQYFGYRSGDYFELTHADILVNGTFFFSTGSPTPSGQYDMPSVVLHELGHFLGLGHISSESSVMRPRVSSGNASYLRTLQTADIREIKSRYNLGTGPQEAALESNGQALHVEQGSGEHIRGVIELRVDGTCVHKENGKVIHVHK
ncbi:MAG: matrixin family metalloprotease [Bacteriovoracaceae bacterium]